MNQKIALFLLKVFSLIYSKYFQGSVPAQVNSVINNRYQALLSAVLAGNVPDINWANVLDYLKLDDGSVVKATLSLQGVWSDKEWAAEVATKEAMVMQLQEQVDAIPKPKDKPDQECLDFYNANIGMVFGGQTIEQQVVALQDELAKRKAV